MTSLHLSNPDIQYHRRFPMGIARYAPYIRDDGKIRASVFSEFHRFAVQEGER